MTNKDRIFIFLLGLALLAGITLPVRADSGNAVLPCVYESPAPSTPFVGPAVPSCDASRNLRVSVSNASLAITSGTGTVGGSATTSLPAAAATVVVKASAGRLVQFLVTVAGTTSLTCYDNASTASGTILGITPATTTVGQVITFNNPAVNGVTCSTATTTPVTTVSYY